MNYSEVKELLIAVFTADEIRKMLSDNPQADNPQNPQENTQVKPEVKPAPVQPEAVPEVQPEDEQRFNQLNSTMEKLIRTIQTSNFNNSSFDSVKETDINTQVDKIMAGIIRPEREQKGGSEK